MNIGQEVWYDGVLYLIEHDYGGGVYRIGNADAFIDMVTENDFELGVNKT